MASHPLDPLTDYTQTHRIVLLIDLHPLLQLPNPTPYTNPLLFSIKTLLSFPPLSSSLFSFKLFFSSLSPLLSSSKLHPFTPTTSSLSLSFHHPTTTLLSLSHTLNSLPNFHTPLPPPPRAAHLAASMRQLLHGYPWDPDPERCGSVIRSNLVVLFSPLCESFKGLSGFFNVGEGEGDEPLDIVGDFCDRFCEVFRGVSDAFGSRDIHCTWVGVRCESECSENNCESDVFRKIYGLFERGIRRLSWGLCSVSSIVLGSALVPFGLIYPKIGISWSSLETSDCSRKVSQVELSLEMLDVNGNPIECNCCDLELIDLNFLGKNDDVWFNPKFMNSQTGGCEKKDKFWKQFGHGITKFQVKVVQRCDAFVDLRDCLSDSVLVVEGFRESKKKQNKSSNEFFADRVLEILAAEFGYLWQRKSVPIWQILLSFLYKEGCWAPVSLCNDNGGLCMGILRPFTLSSALLFVLSNPDLACEFGGASMAQYIRTMDAEICKPDSKVKKHKNFLDSQAKKSATVIEGHPKKKVMDLNTLQNLTWSTFCNAVYDHFETDLYEVYYTMDCNKSKKLKFLKCWLKQMKKPGCCDLSLSDKSKPNQIISEENKHRLTELVQNDEQPISLSTSAGTNTEASRIQDDTALDFRSETSEAFFNNLSNKIHQGIESEVIDLGALAERLVNSSIYWLSQKVDRETIPESQSPLKCHDACGSMVASELIKLLLREPRELAAKHKSRDLFSQASNPEPFTLTMEHIVREYELQILFRMEILQSEVGSGVEESSKQKFVKQICLLLENIQCHMEGGFFGDWNLENYVSKIIKIRYSHTLGDVVHKIYNKMDLLLFADEDETPNHLLNSEDSNKSWKERLDRDEMGENIVGYGHMSAENEPFQLLKKDSGRLQRIKQEDYDKKLIEAKERRERARRFSSFTSWMPDLQRVWAPKLQKGVKHKSDPLQKLPKRKEHQRASYDTVCETPMTGNKRSCQWINNTHDDNYQADGSQTCGSVCKALFQDYL